ncbi:MAG: aspartyl protease family protein [Acetobacteraceae bacterium]|nr:aspartyl protease family protein [Acetobacteraceae bacterium]
MSRFGRRAVLAGLALPLTARAQCNLGPLAVVPLQAVEGFPVLAASVHGTPVTFLLDTGAQAHLVLPAAEAVLRLPPMQGTVPLIGTGGAREAPLVVLEGVQLGSVTLAPAPTPVAALPVVPRVSPLLAGLLGAPLLEQFDLEMDVAAGHLGLYPAGGCGGALPALAPRQTVIPLTITPDRQALLEVSIDGQSVIALLDTGSRATLLTQAAADSLGLRSMASANTSRGVDGQSLPVQHTTVGALTVGDDVVRAMPVSISPVDLGPADMLLGLDYLRQRRVFISYVTSRLVIALPGLAASGR